MAEPARRVTLESLLSATQALAARDPDLAGIVRQFGPPPLWPRQPGFAALVRMILEQQVSLSSAKAVFGRLRHATAGVTAGRVATLGVDGLRACGFTRQKAAYCHELATALVRREVSLTRIGALPEDEGRAELLAIKGIGPWTADVYRLFALRHADVWPHGDVALADAVHRVKRLRSRPAQDRLTQLARQWAPWRSVAARMLWHHYLSSRGRR